VNLKLVQYLAAILLIVVGSPVEGFLLMIVAELQYLNAGK
jgi:hypothetical protein